MMKTPEATGLVLFDLDGTLVDTLDDVGLAMNRALSELSLPAKETTLARECQGLGGLTFPRPALARAERKEEVLLAELNTCNLERYARGLSEHSRLHPGAVAALAGLAAQGLALRLAPGAVALVDDTAIDREADQAVGMRFIHARYGYGNGLDGGGRGNAGRAACPMGRFHQRSCVASHQCLKRMFS